MILKIKNIDNNRYTLINEEGKEYNFKLKFYGIEQNPKEGDTIIFNDKLLDPSYREYSSSYMFGALDEPYGRKITDETHTDLITLQMGNETIKLKRFFG